MLATTYDPLRRWAPAALGLALVAGCRAPGAGEVHESPSIVIATVDDRPLTLQDAMETFVSSHAGHGVLVQGEGAVRELAARLVERELFRTEARALGLPEDEEVLASVETFRRQTAERVFWRREVDERIDVSDEEIEDFYAKTEVALGVTLLETPDRQRTEALRRRAEEGEDLGELALEHSTHPSRTFGGGLPLVRRGEVEPALEKELFAMEEPGGLTPVVRTSDGWAFARLEERTINTNRPPREVMLPQIESILRGRREDELRAGVEERVREAAGTRIDAAHLTREALLTTGSSDAVVARSAGEELTLGGLRDLLDLERVRATPPDEVATAARGIVEDWALQRAVTQAVEAAGLLADPEVVELTEDFRGSAILKALYERYVYADVTITDDDLREYYEARKTTDFTQPAEIHLAYIVVATEEEALGLVQRIEAGEDFSALAREHSIDATSSAHGGRIGWIRPGQLVPGVDERAQALQPGQVDGPIATDLGHFLLKGLERREANPIPFDRARTAVFKRLAKEKQREAHDAWATRLRERAAIEIHEEGIGAAAAWLAAQEEAAPDTPPAIAGDHGTDGVPGTEVRP